MIINLSKDGDTSLFLASSEGHADIVKLLLEHKANPDIVNKVSCFIIMNALVSTSLTFLVSFDLFAYVMGVWL